VRDVVTGGPFDANAFPEWGGRVVRATGTRATFTIDDIARANGPRMPAVQEVNDQIAADFDAAVESCTSDFATATQNRMRLVTVPQPLLRGGDAGIPKPNDEMPGGCGCRSARLHNGVVLVLVVALFTRRRRRARGV
jgi:hypothetical protein